MSSRAAGNPDTAEQRCLVAVYTRHEGSASIPQLYVCYLHIPIYVCIHVDTNSWLGNVGDKTFQKVVLTIDLRLSN